MKSVSRGLTRQLVVRGENWTTKTSKIRELRSRLSNEKYTTQLQPGIQIGSGNGNVTREKSVAQICWERGIKDSLLYKWKGQFEARASSIFSEGCQASVDSAKDAKIAELERIIGQLTVENTILKKVGCTVRSRTTECEA